MKKIFAFLISLSIILFVLLYSIDFMAKDISYYNNFHNEYKIEEESGLSKEWIECASNSLVEFIKSGNVNLNYEECKDFDKKINESDIISIRKEGKFKVDSFDGLTKKNKFVVNIKRYSI